MSYETHQLNVGDVFHRKTSVDFRHYKVIDFNESLELFVCLNLETKEQGNIASWKPTTADHMWKQLYL